MSERTSWLRSALEWAVGSWWVRLAVSVGLLAVVLTQIDLEAAFDRLKQGHWGLFAAACGVYLGAFLLGAVRWHAFLDAAGLRRGWWVTLEAYFAGVFAMNFLPSTFGGDAVRAWLGGVRPTPAGYSVLWLLLSLSLYAVTRAPQPAQAHR